MNARAASRDTPSGELRLSAPVGFAHHVIVDLRSPEGERRSLRVESRIASNNHVLGV